MKPNELIAFAGIAAGLIIAATVAIAFLIRPAQAADDPPLMLARDGLLPIALQPFVAALRSTSPRTRGER